MIPRSRQYFQRKEDDKYEQRMLNCFYCLCCQALNEYECICDWLEEQNEIWQENDWNGMTKEDKQYLLEMIDFMWKHCDPQPGYFETYSNLLNNSYEIITNEKLL